MPPRTSGVNCCCPTAEPAGNVTREIDRFLQDYCPNPDLIRDALLRTGLCSVLDCLPEELVCRRGDRVGGCWLILAGWVEVRSDEQNVTFREAGELIGEQGLLHFLSGKDRSRTADIRANGAARLLCIDAAFQENLQDHEKVAWMQTLATVVNNKLEQATRARSDLRSSGVIFLCAPPKIFTENIYLYRQEVCFDARRCVGKLLVQITGTALNRFENSS
jgi:CRP-like cAMP-binding protein